MGPFLVNLAASAGAVLVLLSVVFAVAARRGRHDFIDIAWGLGFALVATTTFVLSSGAGDTATQIVVTLMTVVWGVRLAVHIGLRNHGAEEDRRYVELRAKATGNPNLYLFRKVYLTQGVVLLFVSLPVQVAQYGPAAPGWLLGLGIAVWLVGFVFEAVGDRQLSRFKADKSNKGKVLDHGLWRYTRHPNYFGDAAVWWGLYLLGCASWPGAAMILSPVLMTFVLAKGTGKPLTEKHLSSSRPGYADYVQRTSGFFPLPPRGTVD